MSNLTSILSIVPRLPPAIDGVGDYAFRLAQQLYQDHQISTRFIVGDPDWSGEIDSPGISVVNVSDRSASSLVSLLTEHQRASSIVLLHFSGYGYAQKSCCFWLVEGLERWRRSTPKARLVTMFHEIYSAFGVPWKHHFWVSPIQRVLAARLIKISDRCLTNTELHAEMLQGLSYGRAQQIPTLPVFSNMGEVQDLLPLSERKKQLVIFGQAGSRMQAYRESLPAIDRVCQSLEIEQILDIGQPTGIGLRAVGEVPLIEMGRRSSTEISQILQTSIAGFLNYDPTRLAKSGVFAAYCAHGLLPVSADDGDDRDQITAGQHYWVPSGSCDRTALQTIADQAYLWYQSHSLSAQATCFATTLMPMREADQ